MMPHLQMKSYLNLASIVYNRIRASVDSSSDGTFNAVRSYTISAKDVQGAIGRR